MVTTVIQDLPKSFLILVFSNILEEIFLNYGGLSVSVSEPSVERSGWLWLCLKRKV